MAKCVFCCVNCCLWVINECIRYISYNAYIQTAIHSTSFCFAAKDAFFLILRNCMRIGMLDALSGLALIFGRFIITLAVGGGAYFIFTTHYQGSMSGLIGATVLCMFVAFVVTGVFTAVYGAVVQTMIQAYITGECLAI